MWMGRCRENPPFLAMVDGGRIYPDVRRVEPEASHGGNLASLAI